MRLLLFTLFTVALLFAQDNPKTGWQKEMAGNLNFTQNTFDNWQQGGENAWAWQLNINGKFTNIQEKFDWSNTIKIAYGKTRVGDAGSKKSTDEIRLESVYTYKLGVYVNPFISFSGVTQFTRGYEYTDEGAITISEFMDPGYFTQTLGVGYSPNAHIKTRLGAAFKETITKKFEDRYGQGKEMRVEYGANSVTDLSFKLAERISYTGKIEMFSNLKRFNEIDVNWDNLIVSQISKYITVNFNVKLYYDRDISKKRQLQEVLAVGLTYTFF
ncbi:DUF3078 domain-containing protein [Calditrichota bacterium GD2]